MATIDFTRLDKTIHEKARLSIMTLLAGRREWSFQDLKAELGMSDGNLISHLRALERAGYVSGEREQPSEGRPHTFYALTRDGRRAFEDYLQILEQILKLSKP